MRIDFVYTHKLKKKTEKLYNERELIIYIFVFNVLGQIVVCLSLKELKL